jgi:hypothetical protein
MSDIVNHPPGYPGPDPSDKFRQEVEAALHDYARLRRKRVKQILFWAVVLSLVQLVVSILPVDTFIWVVWVGLGAGGFLAKVGEEARRAILAVVLNVKDARALGAVAELIHHERKDVRHVAEIVVRRLLRNTVPEQGASLTHTAVEGLLKLLRRGLFPNEAVSVLQLLSQRRENSALEMAGWLAKYPRSYFQCWLSDEDENRVQEAAVHALASIQTNRELQRLRETLLRPAEEGEKLALLRPATNSTVSEKQLLRSPRATDV